MTYNLTTLEITAITVLAVWELIWKGMALWRAAQRHESNWFIAILIINSAGILPIIYILLTRSAEKSNGGGYAKAPLQQRLIH